MGDAYDKLIDCDAADMKNIGGGRAGGSITAAQFLQRYIKDDTPWAHLDIAGVTWSSKDKPTVPKGGTAFGVRLLDHMVAANTTKSNPAVMTEVRFYHLTRSPLESTLPVMLERTLERGQRAVVMTGSEERAEALAAHLWTFNEASFLPHGTKKDGEGERQPVWLTAADEAPNGAEVLFLTDGAASERIGEHRLCAILFDGNDGEALSAARGQWKVLKDAGHEVTYWQQDDRGAWAQKS